jgi:hypothetical protein
MVEVFENLPRTDKAILAALTNLEAEEVDVDRLGKALSSVELPLGRTTGVYMVDLPSELAGVQSTAQLDRDLTDEEVTKHLLKVAEALQQHKGLITDLQVGTLEYVVALLRHYRPEFDSLPQQEQKDLIKGACERVNKLLQASRQLGAFLEYGNPNKDLRSPIEKAQEYVRAAELKDVQRLSDCKIGEILGIDPAPSDSARRQNSRVNHAVKQGKRLFFSAWGTDGWQRHVETKRAELEWFKGLGQNEQGWVKFADDEGLPVEEGLRGAAEAEAKSGQDKGLADDELEKN